jgi:hypothetical protein
MKTIRTPPIVTRDRSIQYLVAWTEDVGDLYVQRVETTGTVTGSPLHVGSTGFDAELATTGRITIAGSATTFLLAYEHPFGTSGLLLGPSDVDCARP